MKTKKEIREEIRRKLGAQGPAERAELSRRIHERLYAESAFREARRALIYLSLPEEVDTLPVIRRRLGEGKCVVVPLVEAAGGLDLREIRDLEHDVAAGAYGIPEPRPERTPRVAPTDLDCIVLPGLAFDRAGNRLGRGGGYFDRLLAAVPAGVPRIALCYAFQIVETLPVEPHDRPVDLVLSS